MNRKKSNLLLLEKLIKTWPVLYFILDSANKIEGIIEGINEMAEQHYQALIYLEGAEGFEEIKERTKEMEENPKVGSAIRDAINRGRYRD